MEMNDYNTKSNAFENFIILHKHLQVLKIDKNELMQENC
jgi:hypothetical protein